jgi:hypothetical protein
MFQFDGGKKERETCFVTHGAMGHSYIRSKLHLIQGRMILIRV